MGWGAYHPSRATVGPQYKLYGYAFFCQCQELSARDTGKGVGSLFVNWITQLRSS